MSSCTSNPVLHTAHHHSNKYFHTFNTNNLLLLSSPYSAISFSAAAWPTRYAVDCVWLLSRISPSSPSLQERMGRETYFGNSGITLSNAQRHSTWNLDPHTPSHHLSCPFSLYCTYANYFPSSLNSIPISRSVSIHMHSKYPNIQIQTSNSPENIPKISSSVPASGPPTILTVSFSNTGAFNNLTSSLYPSIKTLPWWSSGRRDTSL